LVPEDRLPHLFAVCLLGRRWMGDAGEEHVVFRLEPVSVVVPDGTGRIPPKLPPFGFNEPLVGGAGRGGPRRRHHAGVAPQLRGGLPASTGGAEPVPVTQLRRSASVE